MRGRTRGSGDGEEKRLMKKEDFREKTAFSIYIVCLIKGRSICPNPAIFFSCDALCCCIFVFRLGYLQEFSAVFFSCRRKFIVEERHLNVVIEVCLVFCCPFFWSNL